MSMRRRPSNNHGFTLAEILMVSGVLAVVLAGVFVTVFSGQSAYLSMESSLQAQEQARRAFNEMIKEVREAGGTVTTKKETNKSQLDFQMALGYNLASPCPANATCWGAWSKTGAAKKDWSVRYVLRARYWVVTTNKLGVKVKSAVSGSPVELARLVLEADGKTVNSEKILATGVYGERDQTYFEWDSTANTITISLQTKTDSSMLLPGNIRSSGRLTAQVKLRNS